MAAPKNDRLAPPLMYAFRAAHAARDARLEVDIRDQGERVIAPRRVATRAPITETELRRLVGSDISALLNTVNLDSAEDLANAPEVRKSILNFGFPSLTRRTIDENEVNDVALSGHELIFVDESDPAYSLEEVDVATGTVRSLGYFTRGILQSGQSGLYAFGTDDLVVNTTGDSSGQPPLAAIKVSR